MAADAGSSSWNSNPNKAQISSPEGSMDKPPPTAAYRWISFYLSYLSNELPTISDIDFNPRSDLVSLSNILDVEMSESEVIDWLKTLKSALYEAEDKLDLLQLLKCRLKKWPIGACLPSCPLVRPFDKITKNILKKSSERGCLFSQIKRLCNLLSESSFFSGALGISDHPLNASQSRETYPDLVPPVFGCDKECGSIIELLLSNPEPSSCQQYSVVAIVGPPSSGKTTLAQYIFNDANITNHFQIRIWLYVSQKPDVYHHTCKMLESILKEKCPVLNNLDALQRILEEEVQSKNTLLVLDDVWGGEFANMTSVTDEVWGSELGNNTDEVEQMFVDEVHWEQLLAPFSRLSRCKILVTSQSCMLPFSLRSSHIVPKNPMGEQELFEFLLYCVFGDYEDKCYIPEDIQRIVHEIVKKLRFPVDAKLIGSQMKLQADVKAWERLLERVSLSSPSKLIVQPIDIYLQLDEPLKRCFLFCAIFPKGYKHEMTNLVQLWVSECFIKSDDPEKKAEEYFIILLSCYVFKPVGNHESSIKLYAMDDLFQDLADHMSQDDCFRLDANEMVIPTSVYHLSVQSTNLMANKSNICRLQNLRTLILFGPNIDGSHDLYEVFKDLFLHLKKLLVLDISLYTGNDLPKCLSDLKQLRYINVSENTAKKLPRYTHRLQNLQFVKRKPEGYISNLQLL